MSVLLASIPNLHHAYSGTQLMCELSAIMNIDWRGLFAMFADVAWAALQTLVPLHGIVLFCLWHQLQQLQCLAAVQASGKTCLSCRLFRQYSRQLCQA